MLEVSQLMDSTDPDLSRFRARGGKLIILEHMADYAQSPYAGIRYFEYVRRMLGKAETENFARLYTAPGVDRRSLSPSDGSRYCFPEYQFSGANPFASSSGA